MKHIDSMVDDSDPVVQGTVRVVLEGGPADLPSELRLEQEVLASGRVKVPSGGGYEHFELVDEDRPGADGAPVFRWTMRTKIAE